MNLAYLKLLIIQILKGGYMYQNENDMRGLKFTYLWLHQDGSITPYNLETILLNDYIQTFDIFLPKYFKRSLINDNLALVLVMEWHQTSN